MRDDARAIFDAGVEAVDPDCPIKTKKSLSIREVREVRDDMPPCPLIQLSQDKVTGSGGRKRPWPPDYPGFDGVGVLQAALGWVASDLWSARLPGWFKKESVFRLRRTLGGPEAELPGMFIWR